MSHLSHKSLVLVLDSAGNPIKWMSRERALARVVGGRVSWTAGEHRDIIFGGTCRQGAVRSQIELPSIIALKGRASPHRQSHLVPTRSALFRRDRYLCAYCVKVFSPDKLTRDHIVPLVQGGTNKWQNLVSACRFCNSAKGGNRPEQVGMSLAYVPYRPNRAEEFVLMASGRHRILADQMDFLTKGLPAWSRLRLGDA